MAAATITRRGQITIPRQVREHLGVGVGDQLEFTIERAGSVRVYAASDTINDLYGLLHRPNRLPVWVEEMDRAVGEYLAAEDERIRDGRE